MDNFYNPKNRKNSHWFHKKRSHLAHISQLSDGCGVEEDDREEDISAVPSSELDPCISTNELRVFVGTWNVGGRSPDGSLAEDLDEWLDLKEAADIYVLGFQEIVPLKPRNVIGAEDPTEAANWNLLIGKTLNDKYGCPWLTPMITKIQDEDYNYMGVRDSESSVTTGTETGTSVHAKIGEEPNQYKLMASKKMVGVFISVWMKRALLDKYWVSSVKVSAVGCGVMGRLGNKGSVSVSFAVEGTNFCFVAVHLASGEKKGDEVRRNHQVSEIFKRTNFARVPRDRYNHHPLTILGHDRIFWFGDLNYRLYLRNDLARQLIKKKDWRALREYDQLRVELEDGGVFQGWREGRIEFAPTYKYSKSNCNRYSGAVPSTTGEKQRTPAWCDRILWYGKGVKQLSYFRSESKFSDHRPVSALFSTQIEVVKSANPRVAPLPDDVPDTTPSRHSEQEKSNGKPSSTLLSLFANDVEALPMHHKSSKVLDEQDVVMQPSFE